MARRRVGRRTTKASMAARRRANSAAYTAAWAASDYYEMWDASFPKGLDRGQRRQLEKGIERLILRVLGG